MSKKESDNQIFMQQQQNSALIFNWLRGRRLSIIMISSAKMLFLFNDFIFNQLIFSYFVYVTNEILILSHWNCVLIKLSQTIWSVRNFSIYTQNERESKRARVRWLLGSMNILTLTWGQSSLSPKCLNEY